MAKLYFKYGAMGSGKSTVLMQVAHNYERNGFNVFVIKPKIDTKGDTRLVSRIGIEREVDWVIDSCESVYSKINALTNNMTCILVDEAQFLTERQVLELWKLSKEFDIPVMCYGLKTNFKGKLFEGSKALLEVSDSFEELVTVCECGTKARFNARKVNDEFTYDGDEVVIDGTSEIEYRALCGKCYLQKVLKKIKK